MEVKLETVKTLAVQGTAVNMVAVSCLTCILYDHLITLGDEIKMMWSYKISLARVLFFLNRYLVAGLLLFNCISATRANLGASFCVFYMRWLVITLTLSNSIIQGILVLRIWALYRSNKVILCVAFSFYAGGVITLCGLTIQDYVGEDVIINDSLSSLPGCYAKSIPAIIAGYWIAPVCVESVLFALVFSKIFYWWKTGISPPPLIAVLVRDSMIYFSVIFGSPRNLPSKMSSVAYFLRPAFLIANLFMFYFGPPFIAGSLLVTPSAAAGCVMGSHMLLNLRSASSQSWMPARIV